MKTSLRPLLAIAALPLVASAQVKSVVTPDRVRFVLSSLAHDSMEGRGTGTPGSMRAAKFIADQFRLAGLTPAGDSGYFQHVPMFTRAVDPKSAIAVDGTTLRLGVDFAVAPGRADTRSLDGVQVIYGGIQGDTTAALSADQIRGKLVIFAAPPSTTGRRGGPGAVGGASGGASGAAVGSGRPPAPARCRDNPAPDATSRPARVGGGGGGTGRGRGRFQSGGPLAEAAGIATIEGDQLTPRTVWTAKHNTTAFVKDPSSAATPSSPAAANLSLTTHAAEVLLGASLAAAKSGMRGKSIKSTIAFVERPALGGNVIGIIEGADPVLKNEVVLVDAHYDHLGIAMPAAGSTDSIYNGADDDASGTTAVIEIARGIKAGAAPKRTLIFAATTGEEVGLLGTDWYIAHPVRPLDQMIANLEIEMMDRPDSLAGGVGKAWLTGYERSTMGDTLAAHGVPIVKDPRPEQSFFQRSDNIAFARMGIPAHTLSSFDLHRDYHQADDEVRLANFDHMTGVINAGLAAVRLLSDGFKPEWYPGCKP
jgi:hypothetical protein